MKHFKRLGIYKASNVTFDPSKIEAVSYGWWHFVRVINGLVVFNNHRYSPTTQRHQYKVRRLLQELGIKIDIEVNTRNSLNHSEWFESCIEKLTDNAEFNFDLMFAPRKRANTRVKAFEAWKAYNEEALKLQGMFKDRLSA